MSSLIERAGECLCAPARRAHVPHARAPDGVAFHLADDLRVGTVRRLVAIPDFGKDALRVFATLENGGIFMGPSNPPLCLSLVLLYALISKT